jgi:hypothetical protein
MFLQNKHDYVKYCTKPLTPLFHQRMNPETVADYFFLMKISAPYPGPFHFGQGRAEASGVHGGK